MTMWAKVTTQFEALHHYPDAPAPVRYLSNPHRHVFHVTVWVEQFNDDRDIEYVQFKHWLAFTVKGGVKDGDLGSHSCEMVARSIYLLVGLQYPERKLRVEVTEDGENGALFEGE